MIARDAANVAFVRSVQTLLGVDVDGWAGEETRAAFERQLHPLPFVASPMQWPAPDERSLTEFYGEPGERHLVNAPAPYPLRLAWDPAVVTHTIRCHRLVAIPLVTILRELLEDVYRGDLEALRRDRMDLYGGCYALRAIRGGIARSVHSWGAAIDLDPTNNRLGWEWPGRARMPRAVVELFEAHGWRAGARWSGGRSDAMHFQATA